jgi:hypothetical protein
MKKPILYTDEPIQIGEVIPDFPRPDQLAYPPKVRLTLTLEAPLWDRLKKEAAERHSSPQNVICSVLRDYVGVAGE